MKNLLLEHQINMRSIVFIIIYFVAVNVTFAHAVQDSSLKRLSADFQHAFINKKWKLHAPLQPEGLYFTDAPSFYKVKDVVYWSNETFSQLSSNVLNNSVIKDSIVYMILGVYDSISNKQIIDIYEHGYLSDTAFPNPGYSGEFVGGYKKFINSLTKYLNTVNNVPKEFSANFKLYFSAIKPYGLMAIVSDNEWLKTIIYEYTKLNTIKYNPAIKFGRRVYSYHELKVDKTEPYFTIDGIGYGESIFCYRDSVNVYFIEPTDVRVASKLSFVYDKKWTEEEFLKSRDILELTQIVGEIKLIKLLKDFLNNQFYKPYSSIYQLTIDKL